MIFCFIINLVFSCSQKLNDIYQISLKIYSKLNCIKIFILEMNEQNTQKTLIKHQAQTKRVSNMSRRRRGHSLPHFPKISMTQTKIKPRLSLINSKQEKDNQYFPSRCQPIIDELINYVSNSKLMFSSQCKIQLLEQLKLLSKTCKMYSKRNMKSSTASAEFKSQWNEMKNMMISDLNDKIQRQRSKCLSLFEQLTSSLEKIIQDHNIDDNKTGEEEENDENVLLLEQINHIQKNVETVSDQINGFKKIKDELNHKSFPDNKYLDLLTMTIQSLTNFRDSFTHRSFLNEHLKKYENEMKEIFTSIKSDNENDDNGNEGDNENEGNIENERNNDNESVSGNTSTKSVPADTKRAQKQMKSYQQRESSVMAPKEAEEYKELIFQNREIKSKLKRSLDNKRVLEKKKKEFDGLYRDELEKNQKTIKSLQKKKQAANTALQDLQQLTSDVQNMRENMKQIQSRVYSLRQSVDQLDHEGTRKVQDQVELILNENSTMDNDIKQMKDDILTNEEQIYVKQSIDKEKKDQNQIYSIPSLIYHKQNDVVIMRTSGRLSTSFPITIDDPENTFVEYDRLKKSRQEQLELLSKEKMKMKKQISSNELKLQKSAEELHNILLQIKQYSNTNKECNENKILSLFQKTQSDLSQLRSQAKAQITAKTNANNNDDQSLQEIRFNEIKDEISIMDSEVKNMKPLIKNMTKSTLEYREKAKEPKVDALMNSYMEYLIQKRISIDSDGEFNIENEIDKLISQAEAYNGKLSSIINKATDNLNELASRMLGTNQKVNTTNTVCTLQTLGGILRENEIQKQKLIRQIGD